MNKNNVIETSNMEDLTEKYITCNNINNNLISGQKKRKNPNINYIKDMTDLVNIIKHESNNKENLIRNNNSNIFESHSDNSCDNNENVYYYFFFSKLYKLLFKLL